MTIRILGLENCKRCKILRDALEASRIEHAFSDCDHDPENCDALESLTGTNLYPMVLISDADENLLEVVFLASDYEQLKDPVSTQNGIRLIANHSIEGLLRYTINRLHLSI